MSVLKRGSVIYGGGVDISNIVNITRGLPAEPKAPETAEGAAPEAEAAPEIDNEAIRQELELRAAMLAEREQMIAQQQEELAALKESYIEQGKEVILEAKRRADNIIQTANENAAGIAATAQEERNSVLIQAKAEGFEQGQRDGVEACLAAGRDILNEAKAYAERINAEKEQLFADYEQDIYDTVMAIAKKVTLDSITSKDSAAVKRLIKKAAKDFRNSDRIKITLNENGANEELTADYEYLRELCGGIPNIEVELLPDAEEGTVIVDNGSEITDAGIQTQLRMIQELGSGKFRQPRKKKSAEKKASKDE